MCGSEVAAGCPAMRTSGVIARDREPSGCGILLTTCEFFPMGGRRNSRTALEDFRRTDCFSARRTAADQGTDVALWRG